MRIHPFIKHWLVGLVSAFALMGVLIVLLLIVTNEFYRFSQVTRSTEDLLFGPAFGQERAAYKLARTIYLKPDLIILGSSTVTQFRAEMFPSITVYNAGGGTASFTEALAFLEAMLEVHTPRLIMLGVDPWWFDPGRKTRGCKFEGGTCLSFRYEAVVANLISSMADPKFLIDLIKEPVYYSHDPVSKRVPIGYRAARFGSGYRPDGSNQWGDYLTNSDPYYDLHGYGYENGFRYYIEQARNKEGRFRYIGAIPAEKLVELRDFLIRADSAGADVLMFTPPFANALYTSLVDDKGQWAYLQSIDQAVARLARAQSAEYHIVRDLGTLGISDRQTWDGIHIDEVATLALLVRLIRESKLLKRYLDPTSIEVIAGHALANPASRFESRIVFR